MSTQASPRSQSMYASRDNGAAIQSSIGRRWGFRRKEKAGCPILSRFLRKDGNPTACATNLRGRCLWGVARQHLGRFQYQIFPSRPGQKSRQQAGNAVEQDAVFRTKGALAVAFHGQEAKLA